VRLVDDLMDVSRITTGKLNLARAPVEIGAVIMSATETARPLIEAGNHRLHAELPPQPVHVHGDALRLAQVFANLLNNAAKYTPPGGDIAIEAAADATSVTVRVIDTGIGLPRENQPAIFDMFTQAGVAPGRLQSGLGVGLALARHLVELHGGTLTARSEGRDRGSEFSVRLPRLTLAVAGDAGDARRRVLIADDNEDAARSLASTLTAMGHDTRIAHDGRAALELAECERPELVLLDIGLPGLSGYEVARRIRATPWGAGICLVAVEDGPYTERRSDAPAAGFDRHVRRPLDVAALRDILAMAGAVKA
jgi:CheY-like chemotaxis protein